MVKWETMHLVILSEIDIRKENGVWKLDKDGETPILIDNEYFSKRRDGIPVNFNQDHYLPFIQKYLNAIKSVKSSYVVFFEPIPGSDPPNWGNKQQSGNNIMYAPHWYDLKSVFSKVCVENLISLVL